MNCHTCDRPANGVCRFCGRGICKDHESQGTYIMGLNLLEGGKAKVLPVENAIKCNKCRPMEELLEIDLVNNSVKIA